jgi:hypothetical protein
MRVMLGAGSATVLLRMQLISIGNVILNLDRITALDIDHDVEEGTYTLSVLTDSPEAVIEVNLAEEVPDQLINMVPQKMRFVGAEA